MRTGYLRYHFQMMLIILSLPFMVGCSESDKLIPIQLPSVITVEVKDVTNTTATCIGNVTSCGGSTWVNRGICYSDIVTEPTLADNYMWSDAGSHTGSFNGWLEYLTPGITYHVRAYAINKAGNAYGDVITFTTTGNVTGDIVFNPGLTYETVSDIDENSYKTIKIGDQIWMAANLKTTRFNDGADISFVSGLGGWINRGTAGYCWLYNDEGRFKNAYGALYNWYAVNTGNLCPSGWHVPSDNEWSILISYAGGEYIAGSQLKEIATGHWIAADEQVTNSTGFTALPGGCRWGVITEPVQYFTELGYSGNFWSSTEFSDPGFGFYGAYSRSFYYGWEGCTQSTFTKDQGLSVRCIKD